MCQKRQIKRSAPTLGRKPGKGGKIEANRSLSFNLEVVVKSTEYFRESNGQLSFHNVGSPIPIPANLGSEG